MLLSDNKDQVFVWELLCAGFRLSAGHARVILDGAACRLGGGEEGERSLEMCVMYWVFSELLLLY